MSRQGANPTWNFIASDPFTWTDLAKEIIYTDDYVLGAPHTTGAGGKINELLEDLYNRVGYVKRLADFSGNRGYSKNVVINGTRSLTVADSGIITVQTNTNGTPPTSAVVLTLPTRAGLFGAGIGYFNTNNSTPYFDILGAAVTPFMIKGYHTTTGVPLKISVANPTSPGTPVAGDDMAQRIIIGEHSTADLYLYSGEYAEFVPVIVHDTTTDLWYLNWTVHVHNSGYQKFTKGGGGSAVVVGTSGYPSTNFNVRGNYYEFAITDGNALSYMPDNSADGVYNRRNESTSALVYIKVNTSTSGGVWTLTDNGGAAPAGYKKILTPFATSYAAMKDGDILVMIEDTTAWRVVSIIGLELNPVSERVARTTLDGILQGNINTEATTRANADTTLQTNITNEATARSTGDSTLQGAIDLINGEWTLDTDITHWEADSVSMFRPTSAKVRYKKIGKTLHVTFEAVVTSTPNGTCFSAQYHFTGSGIDTTVTLGNNGDIEGVFQIANTTSGAQEAAGFEIGTHSTDFRISLSRFGAIPTPFGAGVGIRFFGYVTIPID